MPQNTVKTLRVFSDWKRKHLIGAINVANLDLITTDNTKVNGDSIIEFLKKLESQHQDKKKIYLICDNAGYYKSKKVKEYLIEIKIELLFPSLYSLNLNLID
jgi:transposase